MQKSGLYLWGSYGDYAGKSSDYVKWREKSIGRTGKNIMIFLLAVVMTVVSVNPMAKYRIQIKSASGQASQAAIGEGVAKEQLFLVPDNRQEPLSGIPVGDLKKEPGETLIVLDPGHGGEDEGCSRDGVQEKKINLHIVYQIQKELLEMGYRVRLTRNGDQELTLEERAKAANETGADLYISIHQNASEEADAEGIEVWYSSQNQREESQRLSRIIQKYAVRSTGAVSRELVENEELYVIRECTMPSCLIETGFLTNKAERKKLESPEYQEQLAKGIAEGIDAYLHPKTMYLTFDDGPSEENTARVLDILKARNIKATFFLVGENVEKHPEMARRILQEGHTIGIHCYSHDYKALYASVDSYLADFEKAQEAIKAATGTEAKIFRFPGGSINAHNKKVCQQIAQEMTDRGYIYYDWNASLEDAVSSPKAETLIQNAVTSTLDRKKVIMLAHDVITETSQCLETLLDQFPEYQMEPLSPQTPPIQF
ncbi:MAG: polysaccharide deacetylase family protein [Lachnospiraceae bacterium]|nr:polysaccharide deacetylase family protein [Lachnospiraceae bacterium]